MSTSVDIQLDRDIQDRIAVAEEARLRADGKGAFSVTYKFVARDFGTTTVELVAPPAGLRGEIKDLNLYDVSEVFNKTSVGAVVNIGTAADPDAYAISANLEVLAQDAAEDFALTDGVTTVLPADTDFQVQFVMSDHATSTGIASVSLTINYFL